MHTRVPLLAPALAGLAGLSLTSAAAGAVCKGLLPSGGGGGAGTRGDRLKLAFVLNVARCMRPHGLPTYPDPTKERKALGLP